MSVSGLGDNNIIETTSYVQQSNMSFSIHDIFDGSENGMKLGIVLNVLRSEDRGNPRAYLLGSRSSQILADVLIIQDGHKEEHYIASNVIVAPMGGTGTWDYSESLPTPAFTDVKYEDISSVTELLAGELEQNSGYGGLRGDWCIIGFIGNSTYTPVMMGYYPHPMNVYDPATAGGDQSFDSSGNYLTQEKRLLKRKNGSLFCLTSMGSLLVDTTQANAVVDYKDNNRVTIPSAVGGSVQIDMKNSQQLEVSFKGNSEGILEEPDTPGDGTFGTPDYPHVQPISEIKSARAGSGGSFRLQSDQCNVGMATHLNGGTEDTSQPMAKGGKVYSAVEDLVNDVIDPLMSVVNALFEAISGSPYGMSLTDVVPQYTLLSTALDDFKSTYLTGEAESPMTSISHTIKD